MSIFYVNGSLLPAGSAAISAHDRGFLLGDGLFETLCAVEGRPLYLAPHLARLTHGANVLGLPLPDQTTLTTALTDTLAANDLTTGHAILRLTVTRGVGPRGLAPPAACHPTVVVTAQAHSAAPASALRAVSAPFRLDATSPLAGLKTLNYLPQVLVRQAALAAGADDGIFLNHQGNLVEACASNLFWVHGGELFTPALSCGPLPGVIRARVLALAADNGLLAHQGVFPPAALLAADEAFLTNSVQGIVPLIWFDGRAVGHGRPGPITAHLQRLLANDPVAHRS